MTDGLSQQRPPAAGPSSSPDNQPDAWGPGKAAQVRGQPPARWVGIATLVCAVLVAGSVALPWYTDCVEDPSSATDDEMALMRVTGSGVDLLTHMDDLGIAPESNALVGGFDADGWYESYLGPGVTMLMAVGLAALGVAIATRHAGRGTLWLGLWTALVSWLAAAITAASDMTMGGSGLRLWFLASVAAAVILGSAIVRSAPARPSTGAAWIGLACVLAFVPLSGVLYGIEDYHPFAAGQVLTVTTLVLGVPAAGVMIGLEVVRNRPRRPLRFVPGVLSLVLGGLVWGSSLLALGA